ncbi:MAG: leucine-rich repeat protein [Clostridia bacterium]|nr:leucine-rich repeat protein [Clostridia bacterium]
MKKLITVLLALTMLLVVSSIGWSVQAAEGDFLYSVENGVATITGYVKEPYGTLVLPNTYKGVPVVRIDDGVFNYCNSLTVVSVPANMVDMGIEPFYGCPNLSTYKVDAANRSYKTVDGVLFNASKEILLHYPPAKTGSFYTVPYGTLIVGANAFSNSRLQKVTISASVTTIEDYAFFESQYLQEAVLPNSVTTLGNYSFCECPFLQKVSISASVSNIGKDPFGMAPSLTAIQIDAANPDYCQVDGVLFTKDMSQLIQMPAGHALTEYTVPQGVTTIGVYAFDGCKKLTSVTLPEGLVIIKESAFGGCNGLQSVTIPQSVTTIEEAAMGYVWDGNTMEDKPIAGFTVRGTAGSYAQTYATENGFAFEEVVIEQPELEQETKENETDKKEKGTTGWILWAAIGGGGALLLLLIVIIIILILRSKKKKKARAAQEMPPVQGGYVPPATVTPPTPMATVTPPATPPTAAPPAPVVPQQGVFCGKCGAKNEPNAVFCLKCGAKLYRK